MKKYNFNPGPSVLPEITLKNTAEAILNLNGSGLSLMEISHRSKDFEAILKEAKDLLRELLDIPSGYSILFLQGGASLQFAMIPYNFLNKKAAYLDSGSWANKAFKEAKLFGEVQVVASSKDQNYTFIPKNYTIPADADYFHITTNNTIYGTELKTDMASTCTADCRCIIRHTKPADGCFEICHDLWRCTEESRTCRSCICNTERQHARKNYQGHSYHAEL